MLLKYSVYLSCQLHSSKWLYTGVYNHCGDKLSVAIKVITLNVQIEVSIPVFVTKVFSVGHFHCIETIMGTAEPVALGSNSSSTPHKYIYTLAWSASEVIYLVPTL